jgi:hypothetical protein
MSCQHVSLWIDDFPAIPSPVIESTAEFCAGD